MKKISTVILAVVLGTMCLTACGNSPSKDLPAVNDGNGQRVAVPGTDDFITKVTVNGVDCIVVDGYRTVAISCDWSSK